MSRGEGHPACRGSPEGVFLKRRSWPRARGIPGGGTPHRFFGRGVLPVCFPGSHHPIRTGAGRTGKFKRNEEISRRISRAGCSFSRRFFSFSKKPIDSVYVLSAKLNLSFLEYWIGRRFGNKTYITGDINHRLWATAGCSAKRKERGPPSDEVCVEPGPARRHVSIIFGTS
jgi:hypothetical protein